MSLPSKAVIDLWFFPVDAPPDHLARWQTYLNPAEYARMARFMFTRDQVRFTVCRSRLRRILAWYTASAPREIKFTSSGHGKPILAGSNPQNLQFNLSHTDGLACLAITHGNAVGVDLERTRDVTTDFIAYTLNPAEHAALFRLAPADHQSAFFRYWTAKEAYLKSIGTGLWQSLKTFDVDVPVSSAPGAFIRGALPRIDDATERTGNWHLYSFQATPLHIGAIAIAPPEGTEIVIRSRWFSGQPSVDMDVCGDG